MNNRELETLHTELHDKQMAYGRIHDAQQMQQLWLNAFLPFMADFNQYIPVVHHTTQMEQDFIQGRISAHDMNAQKKYCETREKELMDRHGATSIQEFTSLYNRKRYQVLREMSQEIDRLKNRIYEMTGR